MKEFKENFDGHISLYAFMIIFTASLVISILKEDKVLILISTFFLLFCSFIFWVIYVAKEKEETKDI